MPQAEPKKTNWSRRALLLGGGVAVVAGGGLMMARKPERGGPHDAYFQNLSAALKRAGVAQPVMVVDRPRLDANIEAARQMLAGPKLPLRVVVKSLPSHGLIDRVAKGLNTDRHMVFNEPMLAEMARTAPQADLLLGKPLPVAAAAHYYETADAAARPPQWLIDTPERLSQYAELARARALPMRASFEIDVGLHRGGFTDGAVLGAALDSAKQAGIEVSGLMGYDPHVAKAGNRDKAFANVLSTYRGFIDVVKEKLGDPSRLILNTAGSPTYALHAKDTPANEVSVGSAFVKPLDFDLDTLSHHQPACFIATPVIKALDRMLLPTAENLAGVFTFLDPNTKKAFFIHGGHWLAQPVSPPGLQYNSLFGRSSNQELLTASDRVDLQPDDFVFFRPTQSEAIFLQFGDLAVYDGAEIAERWSTFPVSA